VKGAAPAALIQASSFSPLADATSEDEDNGVEKGIVGAPPATQRSQQTRVSAEAKVPTPTRGSAPTPSVRATPASGIAPTELDYEAKDKASSKPLETILNASDSSSAFEPDPSASLQDQLDQMDEEVCNVPREYWLLYEKLRREDQCPACSYAVADHDSDPKVFHQWRNEGVVQGLRSRKPQGPAAPNIRRKPASRTVSPVELHAPDAFGDSREGSPASQRSRSLSPSTLSSGGLVDEETVEHGMSKLSLQPHEKPRDPSVLLKVLDKFAKWDSLTAKNQTPRVWLTDLEIHLNIFKQYGTHLWTQILPILCVQPHEQRWVAENIAAKDLSWEHAKAAFINHMRRSDEDIALTVEYRALTQGSDHFQLFADKFRDICHRRGWAPGATADAYERSLIHDLYQKTSPALYDKFKIVSENGRKPGFEPRLESIIETMIRLDDRDPTHRQNARHDTPSGGKSKGPSSNN